MFGSSSGALESVEDSWVNFSVGDENAAILSEGPAVSKIEVLARQIACPAACFGDQNGAGRVVPNLFPIIGAVGREQSEQQVGLAGG